MYVVTEPEFFPSEISLIHALFEAGLQVLHVRKPDCSEDRLREFLQSIKPVYRSRIMLHQHYALQQEFGLKGIHFTELRKAQMADFVGLRCEKSMAVHHFQELMAVPKYINYVLLSPLFPSVSKAGYAQDWDFEALFKHLQAPRTHRIIALGGITPGVIPTVDTLGFDGYAVLGAVWNMLKANTPAAEVYHQYQPMNIQKEIASLQFITVDDAHISHSEQAIRAIKAGCRWVQLRMKEVSDETLVAEARKIVPVAQAYGAILLLNDKAGLVNAAGAQGVHLGKSDLCPMEARKLLGPNKIIGGTANTLDDIVTLTQKDVDYIGLGPFRFTRTKKNLSPVLGIEGYRHILSGLPLNNRHIPVVGIGGIIADDIEALSKTGLHGIALAGAIVAHGNIEKNITLYQSLTTIIFKK